MQQEIEVKFLDVPHDEARERLKRAGAICEQPMRLMRRAIIDYPDRRLQTTKPEGWGFVRVRDQGDKIVCTYKHIASDGTDAAHEIEFVVSSYEQTVELFKAIGLTVFSEQETKRETWRLGDVEIVLDEWPWMPPYIELEGPSEDALRNAADALGYDWSRSQAGSNDKTYRTYYPKMGPEESVADIEHLAFDGERPQWLTDRL